MLGETLQRVEFFVTKLTVELSPLVHISDVSSESVGAVAGKGALVTSLQHCIWFCLLLVYKSLVSLQSLPRGECFDTIVALGLLSIMLSGNMVLHDLYIIALEVTMKAGPVAVMSLNMNSRRPGLLRLVLTYFANIIVFIFVPKFLLPGPGRACVVGLLVGL